VGMPNCITCNYPIHPFQNHLINRDLMTSIPF